MIDEAPQVRVGTLRDLDAVMTLAVGASRENGFVKPNPVRLLHDVYPALAGDRGIVGVIGAGTVLEGAILLRLGKMWYSDDDVIEEKSIFVHPDFRAAKIGRARLLCEFGKAVSDKLDIPLIVGVLSRERTAGKMRMYERAFGPPVGGLFLYNAKFGKVAA